MGYKRWSDTYYERKGKEEYNKNKEKKLEYQRNYYNENIDKVKQYYIKNKEKKKKYQIEYNYKKKKEKENFKLKFFEALGKLRKDNI